MAHHRRRRGIVIDDIAMREGYGGWKNRRIQPVFIPGAITTVNPSNHLVFIGEFGTQVDIV
jgi:hypothetical protein